MGLFGSMKPDSVKPRTIQPSTLYPGILRAPSASDFELSNSSSRSTSLASPSPSHRGHMPPVISNERRSLTFFPPFSKVTAPAPDTEGMLNEKACGEPTCGCPRRLNRMRSIACASVAVPTVEREFAPIRSWSTMIAGLTFSSASTSGRLSCPMNCCTNVG